MKIAVSGKGGVGKSTVAAALALLSARSGSRVLALDADPDANLASALGVPHDVQATLVPISRQIELIEERTGARVSRYGQVFNLNPRVSDVAGKYAYTHRGVSLLTVGAVRTGGGGCACPENTFIKSLVMDLILFKDETLVMDMEAGIEHFGRATARGVDLTVVVVEPGQRSIDCALSIVRMAGEIGLKRLAFVANKVVDEADERFLREALPGRELLGIVPYSRSLRGADRDGLSVLDGLDAETEAAFRALHEKVGGFVP